MTFHTKWSPRLATAICFDLPVSVQDQIQLALSRQEQTTLLDIYSMQVIILDEIIQLFDESVWAIRDAVRNVEKVNLNKGLVVECDTKCSLLRLGTKIPPGG